MKGIHQRESPYDLFTQEGFLTPAEKRCQGFALALFAEATIQIWLSDQSKT
jgi:hypothetical protein